MRTVIIIAVLFFSTDFSFGQVVNMKKAEPNTTQSPSLSAEQKQEVQKRISQIDSHLNSIEIKWDYILEHPEEKEIAEEKGWFNDMNRIKNELIEEKKRLLDLLD